MWGDRYDAWNIGYNEIFSPYSNPNTKDQNNNQTGIFIYYHGLSGNKANISIYKVGENGTEDEILALTPPSKPMGIKTSYYFENENICHPKITWTHNTEPDMLRSNNTKKYIIYRALSNDMNTLPGTYYVRAVLEINQNSPAEFVDYQIIGIESNLGGDGEYEPYPLRYKVIAVDKDNDESVFSDFSNATGLKPNGSSIDPGNNDNLLLNPEVPKEFSISQNYPNPFNPVTNIQFQVPSLKFVKIVIYDILGREVKVLVNEIKSPGNHSVTFDASSLSSGVYFYKISAGEFSDVKRMVLIK